MHTSVVAREEGRVVPKIQFSVNKTPENPVFNEDGVRDVMRANPLSSCFDSIRRSGLNENRQQLRFEPASH